MEASALRTSIRAATIAGRSPLLRLQSDERLIELTRRGNDHAFEALVRRYESRLLAFCRHMLGSREDAEDILQEVFAAAYNALLADDRPINTRPWLYRIARNRCLNHLRRPQAQAHDSMEIFDRADGVSAADAVADREEFRSIIADVQELPETQRTALLLREIDSLSYEQIAEAMDTTVPSVKSLLVRARISLAEAAEARLLTCDEVRVALARDAEGIAPIPAPVRRHLRRCDRCRAFREHLKETSRALAMLFPSGPIFALKHLLASKLGLGGGAAASGGAAIGGGSGACATAGGCAAGSLASAAGSGVVAGATSGAVAAGAAGAAGGVAGGALSAGLSTFATKAAAATAAAAVVAAGAIEVRQVAVPGPTRESAAEVREHRPNAERPPQHRTEPNSGSATTTDASAGTPPASPTSPAPAPPTTAQAQTPPASPTPPAPAPPPTQPTAATPPAPTVETIHEEVTLPNQQPTGAVTIEQPPVASGGQRHAGETQYGPPPPSGPAPASGSNGNASASNGAAATPASDGTGATASGGSASTPPASDAGGAAVSRPQPVQSP